MIEFIPCSYIKYYLGNENMRVHVDALHAQAPKEEIFTAQLVEGIVEKTGCSGIIATVSRTLVDLNRPRNASNSKAIDEYRQTIKMILTHIHALNEKNQLTAPYLHLSFHGMKDDWNQDVEIGTRYGTSCSKEIKDWFVAEVDKHIDRYQVDGKFSGDPSKPVHRYGDTNSDLSYIGFGDYFNTFQIEISRDLRENHLDLLINLFSGTILRFSEEFQ
jgi:hypothetical protein